MFLYVRANAKRLSDIGDELEGVTLPLLESLAQLYLFPDTEYKNHWRVEVWEKLSEIPKIKRSHKLPKKEYILKNTWHEYNDKLKTIMNRAVAHEYDLTPDLVRRRNVSKFYNICESYMNWIADKLSKDGIIDPEDVYHKLDDLGL